jgi:peptidoglycan hydrolase-like protein with peptidoglycan-binding domain
MARPRDDLGGSLSIGLSIWIALGGHTGALTAVQRNGNGKPERIVVVVSEFLDEQESLVSTHRQPRRRRWVLTSVLLIVIVAAGGSWAVWKFDRVPAHADNPPPSTGIATVKRQTLEEHTQVDGRLGYEGSYQVVNQSPGILTSVPSVGQVIKSGQALYRVDNKPVILLRGEALPAYRSLSKGLTGPDVKQLNAALVALGYAGADGPKATSDYFGDSTKNAVERLQGALSVTKDGQLALGQMVFLPIDQLRITKVNGTYGAGAPTGQPLLEATSIRRVVNVAMDATLANTVKVGDNATVSLPSGDVPAVVSSIGRVATTTDTGGTTIPVNIRLKDDKSAAGLDAASVKVVVTSGSKKDVLAVPVTALLAKSGGGYNLEVVDANGTHHLESVKIGMIDGEAGMVEVSGSGLSEGQQVVVPAS